MRRYDGTSAGGLVFHTFTIAIFERFRSRRIVQYVSDGLQCGPPLSWVSGALLQALVMLSLPPAIFHHRESLSMGIQLAHALFSKSGLDQSQFSRVYEDGRIDRDDPRSAR